MKIATVRELRNEFSRLSKWLERGETVQIVKRGRPFARVVPEPKPGSFFGATPSATALPADLDDPPPVTWKVEE